jgi:hypothetical protein
MFALKWRGEEIIGEDYRDLNIGLSYQVTVAFGRVVPTK